MLDLGRKRKQVGKKVVAWAKKIEKAGCTIIIQAHLVGTKLVYHHCNISARAKPLTMVTKKMKEELSIPLVYFNRITICQKRLKSIARRGCGLISNGTAVF